jgi:O-antigen/teichoic acid export membrane protein
MAFNQASYKQIFKATSIFGGVQVFNIFVSLIRSKFIAVFLGPVGMGISGLFVSATGLIGSITNFGLASSAVKSMSIAVSTGDNEKVGTTVSVIRRLVWITGLLGTLFTFFLSTFLSKMTFGNSSYSMAFMGISITLLLSQLSAGQTAILQGMRKLNYLVKADVAGVLVGLLVSIPIYFMLGIKGIVPTMIISSFLGFLFSWFFVSKVQLPSVSFSKSIFRLEGMAMLKLGFMLSLTGQIAAVTSYFLRIFIGKTGGLEDVGFYNAGFAIINTYVGMIFTAMATDYYPRLAGVSSDNSAIRTTINEQAEIAILLIAPILIAFLIFIHRAVVLLYTKDFIAVNEMLHWAALGMFFKTVSWAIGFVFLAKGSPSLFFWNELAANVYMSVLNVLGYYYLGLSGLGVSFMIGYFLFFLQVFMVAKKYYAFSFKREFCKIFFTQLLFGILCFMTVEMLTFTFSFLMEVAFIVCSIGYSFFELNKRLAINQLLLSLKSKIR